MKTKHTKEYAKKLLSDMNGVSSQTEDEMFIMGYMAALEQTAAPDLLEASKKALKQISDYFYKIPSFAKTDANIIMIELQQAIKKATE